VKQKEERGSIAIIAAVAFLPIALMLAVVADTGRSWVAKHTLQNGVEAGAVAAAQEWSTGGQSCASGALNLVTADGATPANTECSVTGNPLDGVVRVQAFQDVDLLFSSLLGRETSRVDASTGVKIAAAGGLARLWPIALCAEHPAVKAWLLSGMTSNVAARITFSSVDPACTGDVSGNWTVLDFSGGANSNTETAQWVAEGYPSVVRVGDVVPGNPGVPSTSIGVNGKVGKSILMPLFSQARSQGGNAMYTIVGFAQAKLLSAQLSGATAQRNITIQFERGTVSGEAGSSDETNFGITSWSVCSFDSEGDC
jgi:hypothetical protein